MNENKNQTFVSYSPTDAKFALKLAKDLKTAGFQIWLDQMDIPAGGRWLGEVLKVLAECSIFMVILTPEAIESQNVKDEIGYAIDSHKRILPILLKPCNIPFRLRRFQYVDFTVPDYDLGVETTKNLLIRLVNETALPKQYFTAPYAPEPKAEMERKERPRLAGDSSTDAPPPPKKD